MWGRAAWILWTSVPLLAGCGHLTDAAESAGVPPAVVKQSLAAPVPVAATPTAEAIGSTQAGETPACPPPDAWGRDPLGEGILVTVWSDHADDVTVLVRTSTGPDRARSAVIDPRDRFHIFAFPDVDHRAVVDTLVMTNTENCYATLDPATDSG